MFIFSSSRRFFKRAGATFIAFGDSLTELGSASDGGWVARLSEHYGRRADVLNRGYSGYNTRWALYGAMETLAPHILGATPSLVIVWFGANDAASFEHNARQHVPEGEFVENLVGIANIVRSFSTQEPPRIVVIGCTPVGHAQRLEYQKIRYGDLATGVLERTNEQAKRYSSLTKTAANLANCTFVDMWEKMTSDRPDGSWTDFLSDGLHLSPEGNRFAYEAILHTIESTWPELKVSACPRTGSVSNSGSTSALPVELPLHDTISDANAYAAAFRKGPLSSGYFQVGEGTVVFAALFVSMLVLLRRR